ncbi:MAG: hypothetical protein AAF299_11150 [Pseudomonadota bacterium]
MSAVDFDMAAQGSTRCQLAAKPAMIANTMAGQNRLKQSALCPETAMKWPETTCDGYGRGLFFGMNFYSTHASADRLLRPVVV